MHFDNHCKRTYQHKKLIMRHINGSSVETFQKVHRGHRWGLDRSSSNHHIQEGSYTTLQTERNIGK